jgi:hypothetical protein
VKIFGLVLAVFLLSNVQAYAQTKDESTPLGFPFKALIQDNLCSSDNVTLGDQKACIQELDKYVGSYTSIPSIVWFRPSMNPLKFTAQLVQALCDVPQNLEHDLTCFENSAKVFEGIALTYRELASYEHLKLVAGQTEDHEKFDRFSYLSDLSADEYWKLQQLGKMANEAKVDIIEKVWPFRKDLAVAENYTFKY